MSGSAQLRCVPWFAGDIAMAQTVGEYLVQRLRTILKPKGDKDEE